MQVTLTLSEETYKRAERLAEFTRRNVIDVLTEIVESSLPDISSVINDLPVVEQLSDKDLLHLAESRMPAEQNARMSALLDKQQNDVLTLPERGELQTLLQLYDAGMLRKALAMAEAVRRGLNLSLQS